MACSYRGLYLDANAIAPQKASAIGQAMSAAGADFVDGGVIGGPVWEADKTSLYLSGPSAAPVAAAFAAGPLATRVIGHEIGKASALKMCYAAHSKGVTALLYALLAVANHLYSPLTAAC